MARGLRRRGRPVHVRVVGRRDGEHVCPRSLCCRPAQRRDCRCQHCLYERLGECLACGGGYDGPGTPGVKKEVVVVVVVRCRRGSSTVAIAATATTNCQR